MESSSDKEWASKQLLDPLIAPDPASEDGPGGSHFGNTLAGTSDKRSPVEPNSEKKGQANVSVSAKAAYPTPPASASPSRSAFPDYREQGFTSRDQLLSGSPRQSSEIPTSTVPSAMTSVNGDAMPQRRRGSSLTARYPGDTSHRPLDTLRAHANAANRHTRRSSRVGADTIDQLDIAGLNGLAYHHDGPYDATLMGRNLRPEYSPLAATVNTNREALRATPREFIADAVQGHRPLMGTSTVPPGQPDRYGRVLSYREGPNLNVEMGWRRWKGIDYHPDDIKGKGEPYYTIDRALKDHDKTSSHRRIMSDGGIELTERPRSSSNPFAPARRSHLRSASGVDADNTSTFREEPYTQWADSGMRRANTTGRRTSGVSGALKSKFGSLRRRKPVESRPNEHEEAEKAAVPSKAD